MFKGLQHLACPAVYPKVNLGKRASDPSLVQQSSSATSAMSANSTPARRQSNPEESQSEKRNNNSKPPASREAAETHQLHRSTPSRSERRSSSGRSSSTCSKKSKDSLQPSFAESQLQPLLSPIRVVSRQEIPTQSDVISGTPDPLERQLAKIVCSPVRSRSTSSELLAQSWSSTPNVPVPTEVQLSHLPPLDQLSGIKSSTSFQKASKDVSDVPNKRKSGSRSGDPANPELKRPKCESKGISSACYSTVSSECDVPEANELENGSTGVKKKFLGAALDANAREIEEIVLSDIDSLSEASTILRANDSQVTQDPPVSLVSLERSSPKEGRELGRDSGNPVVDSALQVDISNVLLESGTQTEPLVAVKGVQTDQLVMPVKGLAHKVSQTQFVPIPAAKDSIQSVVASTQVNFFVDMSVNEPVEPGKDSEMEAVKLYQQLEQTVMNRDELNVELNVLETERESLAKERKLDTEAWGKLVSELKLSTQFEVQMQEAQHGIAVKLIELDAEQVNLCDLRRRAQFEAANSQLLLGDPSVWEGQKKALTEQKEALISELQKQREKRVAHRLLYVKVAETRKALEQKIDNHLVSYAALQNRIQEVQDRKRVLSKEIRDIQRRVLILDYQNLRYKTQRIEREPAGTLVLDFPPKSEAAKRAAMMNVAKGMPEVPPELVHEFMHTLVFFHSFILVSMEDPAIYQAWEPDRSKIAQVFDRMKTFFAGNFTEERANYVLYLWQEQLNSSNRCTLCQNVVSLFDYRHVKRTVLEIRRHSKTKKALVDSLTC